MADEDVHELARDLMRQAEEKLPQGLHIPDGDEDEAMHSVQQQLADAGLECDADEARRIVREARGQES